VNAIEINEMIIIRRLNLPTTTTTTKKKDPKVWL